MLKWFREMRPGTPLSSVAIYAFARGVLVLLFTVLYRFRAYGSRRVPKSGAVLLVANHQSYLDPPAIGVGVSHRHLDYVARHGLFGGKVLGWLLKQFNSLPIREQGGDTGAIKEILRRIGDGRAVLIFPEGTRTFDGSMSEFKRGVAVLVKRSGCPVVPIAVEGCFDAWPRQKKWPNLFGKRIAVAFGRPIAHDELLRDGAEAALRALGAETQRLRMSLRRLLRKQTHDTYPPPGPGDSAAVPANQSRPETLEGRDPVLRGRVRSEEPHHR
jgi:1-acyl-sn-glycerol-3-phosphate acyltransferase